MAAAATEKKQDNRKPNLRPNHMPAAIVAVIKVAGVVLGTLNIEQGDKLSPSGAVTYFGRIRKGWRLAGDSNTVLKSLAFTVNDIDATVATAGVHSDKKNRPVVFHSAVLPLDDNTGQVRLYTVQVIVTFLGGINAEGKGEYSLQIVAFPAGNGGGPVVRGELSGEFEIDGV